jgi:hypothetical protein
MQIDDVVECVTWNQLTCLSHVLTFYVDSTCSVMKMWLRPV